MLYVDNIGMLQEPEELDLPEDPDRVGDAFKDVGDTLDRHLLPCEVVDSRGNNTVGTFSDDLLDGVSIGLGVLC